MIVKEYLGDEKIKRILSGEPFWCCAAFIDGNGLQIIKPRESQLYMNWYNSLIEKSLEYHQYMLYGYPVKNVSVFDCQEDCRESFVLMLDNLSGYTCEKEYIPPIDVAAVRKTMKKISEGIKILDMLNRWLEDE